jgi:hypothetical protein
LINSKQRVKITVKNAKEMLGIGFFIIKADSMRTTIKTSMNRCRAMLSTEIPEEIPVSKSTKKNLIAIKNE